MLLKDRSWKRVLLRLFTEWIPIQLGMPPCPSLAHSICQDLKSCKLGSFTQHKTLHASFMSKRGSDARETYNSSLSPVEDKHTRRDGNCLPLSPVPANLSVSTIDHIQWSNQEEEGKLQQHKIGLFRRHHQSPLTRMPGQKVLRLQSSPRLLVLCIPGCPGPLGFVCSLARCHVTERAGDTSSPSLGSGLEPELVQNNI